MFCCSYFLLSCSSDEDTILNVDVEETATATYARDLAKIFGEVLNNKSTDNLESDYIIYIAEGNEFMTLTEEDYLFYSAIANVINREQDCTIQKSRMPNAPQGNDWKFFGKGKRSNRTDAFKKAIRLSNDLERGRDVEIRITYDDTYYYIWYRYI